jgi:hypothetical protein
MWEKIQVKEKAVTKNSICMHITENYKNVHMVMVMVFCGSNPMNNTSVLFTVL